MGLAVQEMGPEDIQERKHNLVEKPTLFVQRSLLLSQGGSPQGPGRLLPGGPGSDLVLAQRLTP